MLCLCLRCASIADGWFCRFTWLCSWFIVLLWKPHPNWHECFAELQMYWNVWRAAWVNHLRKEEIGSYQLHDISPDNGNVALLWDDGLHQQCIDLWAEQTWIFWYIQSAYNRIMCDWASEWWSSLDSWACLCMLAMLYSLLLDANLYK